MHKIQDQNMLIRIISHHSASPSQDLILVEANNKQIVT